jgi:uncharacterized YccA/Bax inhibitor family protein
MSSPVLNEKSFLLSRNDALATDGVMTVKGNVNKAFILLLLAGLGASVTWKYVFDTNGMGTATGLMWAGLIGGLIFALVAIFSPRNSRWAAPLYAIFEGLALGAISALYEVQTAGIVFQAVFITFAVLFLMLFLYRTGTIKVTSKLSSGIIIATGAVAIFYLAALVSNFFTPTFMNFLHDNTALSIGISVVIAGIAAFNFLLDFDFIQRGSECGAP